MVFANTFLIGAQKSGTTYLAALLDQSPDVCVSDPKEPHYLTHQFSQGPEYYARCFSDPDAKIRLDASTTYTVLRPRAQFDVEGAPGILDPVPQRIMDNAPEARLIYIMRDPVRRATSAYRHHMRRKDEAPQGSLSLLACMDADPMLVLAGRYADQIERYLEVFPRERFLFLDFRDLIQNPDAVLGRVCEFLQIAPPALNQQTLKTEKNAAYQLSTAGRLLRRSRRFLPGLTRTARRVLPEPVQRVLLDKVLRKPSEIVFHDEEAAALLFAEDRARVEALTGLKI